MTAISLPVDVAGEFIVGPELFVQGGASSEQVLRLAVDAWASQRR